MARATLKSLPGDVLILILSNLPDPQSLKAVVESSSAVHAAYRTARHQVLCDVLENYHDGLVDMADAVIAIRSQGRSITDVAHYETIVDLLDGHKRVNYATPGDVNETIKLLQLHKIMLWLVKDLDINMKAPYWINNADWAQEKPLNLSRDEKRRIFRGLYRLQIWANSFGSVSIRDDQYEDSEGFYQMVNMFFLRMPPWETEEIASIWCMLRLRVLSTFYRYLGEGHNETATLVTKGPRAVYKALKDPSKSKATAMTADTDRYLEEEDMMFFKEYSFHGLYAVPIEEGNNPFQYPADQYRAKRFSQFERQIATMPLEKRPNLCWLKSFSSDRQVDGRNLLYDALIEGGNPMRCNWGWVFWDDNRVQDWELERKI